MKIEEFIKDRKSIYIWSFPRSGTHIVMRYLLDNGFTEFCPDTVNNGEERLWEMPKTNHFCFGGHRVDAKTRKRFRESSCKGIYTSRDPKDVMISLVHFIKEKETNNCFHQLFIDKSVEECVKYLIDGYNGIPPFKTRIDNNNLWIKEDNVLHVTFEDMIHKVQKPTQGDPYMIYFRKGEIGDNKNYNIDWKDIT